MSAGATSAFAQNVTIRYSSWLPVNHWLNQKQFVPWFAEVEKVTEGRVKVEMLPKTVGTAATQFDVVRDGLADMSFIIPSYTPGRFPLIEMGELPLLGEDATTMSLVFERVYRKHFMPLNEFAGAKILGVWNITPVQPFNAKRPVTTVADLKGLKLRSPNNVITTMLTSIGAVPILKSSMEAFEMLSTKAIDGQVTQADTVVVNHATNLMKYGTIVPGGLANSAHILAINPDKWAQISERDRKAIEAITTEKLSQSVGKGFQDNEVVAMKAMEAAGYEIIRADERFTDELRPVIAPIEEDWIKRAKAKGVADPAAVLEEFRKEIATAQKKTQ
jgi:TRAP-type C4-dicarboxylate transport system substrate-binding protein